MFWRARYLVLTFFSVVFLVVNIPGELVLILMQITALVSGQFSVGLACAFFLAQAALFAFQLAGFTAVQFTRACALRDAFLLMVLPCIDARGVRMWAVLARFGKSRCREYHQRGNGGNVDQLVYGGITFLKISNCHHYGAPCGVCLVE